MSVFCCLNYFCSILIIQLQSLLPPAYFPHSSRAKPSKQQTKSLLLTFQWLPISCIIEGKFLIEVYRLLHYMAPGFFVYLIFCYSSPAHCSVATEASWLFFEHFKLFLIQGLHLFCVCTRMLSAHMFACFILHFTDFCSFFTFIEWAFVTSPSKIELPIILCSHTLLFVPFLSTYKYLTLHVFMDSLSHLYVSYTEGGLCVIHPLNTIELK